MPGSSNLKAQDTKFRVKEIKEKSVTFCFPKVKAKEKANFSKSSDYGDFSVEILGHVFQS